MFVAHSTRIRVNVLTAIIVLKSGRAFQSHQSLYQKEMFTTPSRIPQLQFHKGFKFITKSLIKLRHHHENFTVMLRPDKTRSLFYSYKLDALGNILKLSHRRRLSKIQLKETLKIIIIDSF